MRIGSGIFLIAVGAALTFAVHASFKGIDIAVLGVILMAAGVLGIALELAMFGPRRRRSVTYDATTLPARRTTTRDEF